MSIKNLLWKNLIRILAENQHYLPKKVKVYNYSTGVTYEGDCVELINQDTREYELTIVVSEPEDEEEFDNG